ncbi:MAG: ABC transporter permease [Spirochaetales bacterium]|nr:ABC transporter permease [Spirochaetales bacterium]
MNRRLLINDFKANRLVTASTSIFMAASALLLGLSILLFGTLTSAIDSLMAKALTPDFIQMHTGTIDEERIARFSEKRSDVEALQISRFLNLQNSQVSVGGTSLVDSTQDNGLSVQSPLFDFLIDLDNEAVHPAPGEVYVPVAYIREYGLKVGDLMRIGSETLTIAGFIRDSQMNAMMASSKRFLVSEADYERFKPLGSEEYLIEFRLAEGSDVNAFATAYEDAGLPGNGPTITRTLIMMMNALSDGMMILVILLVSVVVLFISMLSIRYMILTRLEKDKREIGLLKAVGIARREIRGLYFSKYLLLSAVGGLVGIGAAMLIAKPLGAQIRDLYGDGGNMGPIYALMILGALVVEGIILLSVYRTLGRMERMSAVQALYGRGDFGKRKNLYLPIGIITAAAVFMILVPWNIGSTLASPEFVTYMGVGGNSRIRIDIRQTDRIGATAHAVVEELERDERVLDHAVMQTGSYRSELPDGSSYNLLIEQGDHERFPVRYIEGGYPRHAGEIALSVLNASELDLRIGDPIRVFIDVGTDRPVSVPFTVSGIYSDVTNGGKTAKISPTGLDDRTPIMWSIIYVALADERLIDEWIEEYRRIDDAIKAVDIADYIDGLYGQTIRTIRKTAILTVIAASAILFVVLLLLLRLVIWRERSDNSLKKALGFTTREIKKTYLKKTLAYLLPGMAVGILLGLLPGQSLVGAFIGLMGAHGFRFIIDPIGVFATIPLVIAAAAMAATLIGLEEVGRIHAYECLGPQSGDY